MDEHKINLKKCSITDGYGLQEVLLIQGFIHNFILQHPKTGVLLNQKNVTTETPQSPVFQITRQQSNEHQQKSYDHQELSEVVAIQVLCFLFKVGASFIVQMNRQGHEFGDRFGHRHG